MIKYIQGVKASLICLSTDTKPSTYFDGTPLPVGSEALELNTGYRFLFDGRETWYQVPNYSQAVPSANSAANSLVRDVVGNKSDTAVTTVGVVASVIAYIKGILNQLATVLTNQLELSQSGYGDTFLQQVESLTSNVKNGYRVLFHLDALGGAKKDIKLNFFMEDDVAATFIVSKLKTRSGAPTTLVADAVAETIATPAVDAQYSYDIGDLEEGQYMEIRIAQDDAGAATGAIIIDAQLTYVGAF